tara:strand:- start:935 stop:2131 length:1197 start_codon:yes stop_codon:yes gene_type:complete
MTTPNLAPTAHHPRGPSSWPMLDACPRYTPEPDKIEPDDADIEAEAEEFGADAKGRGSAQHAALAKCLTTQPDPFAGLADKETEQVQWAAEKAIETVEAMGYSADDIRVEQRVTMMGEDFRPLYFGTADILFGPAGVIDAKFGDMRDYWPQLVGYGLPLMIETGVRKTHGFALFARLRRVRTYVTDFETAESYAYRLLARADDPRSAPKANPYCGWCANKLTCEAFTKPIVTLIEQREDWPLKLDQAHASQIGMDPVQAGLARWLWKSYVEPWGKAVEYQNKMLTEGGATPLGFRRQPQQGSWKVTDTVKALEALRKVGLPLERVLAEVSPSMTGLVKAWRAEFGGSEAKAKDAVLHVLKEAQATAQGDGITKLLKLPDGEEQIRAGLGLRAQHKLTE